MQILCAILIQGDADGEALLDLNEVARCIVDGDERVRATGGIGETEDAAFVRDFRNDIHMDIDLGTFMDMRQLRLAVVGFDPEAMLIHDADKRVAFANMLVRLEANLLNKTLHVRVLRRDVLSHPAG